MELDLSSLLIQNHQLQTPLTDQPISINKKVFQELFDLHFNALCSFGCRFIDQTIIEDVVQDVFIALWHKRTDFNQMNTVKAYLYKSVRNKCLNFIRDEAVRKKHLEYQLASDSAVEQIIIEEETFNRLYSEIKGLPLACQQVMLLALNGLKNPEIAEELNISLNTVKTQKKIAYSKLKSRLSPLFHAVLFSL